MIFSGHTHNTHTHTHTHTTHTHTHTCCVGQENKSDASKVPAKMEPMSPLIHRVRSKNSKFGRSLRKKDRTY